MAKTPKASDCPQESSHRLHVRTLTPSMNEHRALHEHIKDVRRDFGIFFTPERIVDFMSGLADKSRWKDITSVSILEPACGLAQFLAGMTRKHPELSGTAKFFGVEINPDIVHYLKALAFAKSFHIINTDYLLWEPGRHFDLIIGNPPYGIPSLSEHYTIKIAPATKGRYKEIFETWFGKYNVYGAFIEKSVKLLKPDGQAVLIVPATFLILDEFKKLRQFLSGSGRSEFIYCGSEVFKPDADVAALVLNFKKSASEKGLRLMEFCDEKVAPIREMAHWKGEVVTFETPFSQTLESICSFRLGEIFEIRISPRTPEIKHNPFVTRKTPPHPQNYLPLLNGRNLKCNEIIYDNLTGYWIKKGDMKSLRGYFGVPHIVVGLGFRENGRVAAAYDEKCYPWMGDIYHLTRKNNLSAAGAKLDDRIILEYLNSNCLRRYIREIYRNITYHLSITQLKEIPIPTKSDLGKIKKIREIQSTDYADNIFRKNP
jgi:adenine-specific DNA-methyltransferase